MIRDPLYVGTETLYKPVEEYQNDSVLSTGSNDTIVEDENVLVYTLILSPVHLPEKDESIVERSNLDMPFISRNPRN
jgi:hypothetical protein